MSQNVIRAAVTVFGFWWIVLGAYGVIAGIGDPAYLVQSTLAITVLVVAGIVMGVLTSILLIWSKKKGDLEMLAGESVRGLICTLGELPVVQREPPRASALPDLTKIPDVDPGFYGLWFEHHERNHPKHAALMRALILVLAYNSKLPATHIAGGHGGRTLFDHSMLVGFSMERLGRTWTYTGLRGKKRNNVILHLRDPNYKFNADDPMVAIIGLAHDIGKIESYIYDPKDPNAVIGIANEHDLTGARMIARLPEAWEIPDEDRTAMFLAIAHYHHPMDLPLSPDRRVVDDRTIALMELLIKADFVTSAIEAKGVVPTDEEYEKAFEEQGTQQVEADALFNAMKELILESERVNSANRKFNIATLCEGQGFNKPMLFIREDALRGAMYGRLKLPLEQPMGDGRYPLTVQILRMLAEKGVLVQEHQGKKYRPENALWNVDFGARPAAGAHPEKKAGWSAVIVIDPVLFPAIEKMSPYWWHARIMRPTMGSARAAKAINAPDPGTGTRLLDEKADEIEEIKAAQREEELEQEQAASRPQEVEEDIHDDEAAEAGLKVSPRRQKKPANVAATQNSSKVEAPSPRDGVAQIQEAIAQLVRAMVEQKFVPHEVETHYLITYDQLAAVVPDFDWSLSTALVPLFAEHTKSDLRCVQPDPQDSSTIVIGIPKVAPPQEPATAEAPPASAGSATSEVTSPTTPARADALTDDVWDAEGGVAAQEATAANVAIAFIDIVRRAEADALEVPRQNDLVIMSASALHQAYPQIDWRASLSVLTAMCEREEIKARIRASNKAGAGGFFMEFSVDDYTDA